MSHSYLHPCSWCDSKKDSINSIVKETKELSVLWEHFLELLWRWCSETKGKISRQRRSSSVVLLQTWYTSVISLVPPPELHLLTGPVNTIFSALKKLWPQADEWLVRCGIQRECLHGGSFTGNASRMLLANVCVLENMHGSRKSYCLCRGPQAFQRRHRLMLSPLHTGAICCFQLEDTKFAVAGDVLPPY